MKKSLAVLACFGFLSLSGCAIPWLCLKPPLQLLAPADIKLQKKVFLVDFTDAGRTSHFFLAYEVKENINRKPTIFASIYTLEGAELLFASYDGHELTESGPLAKTIQSERLLQVLQFITVKTPVLQTHYGDTAKLSAKSRQLVSSCEQPLIHAAFQQDRWLVQFDQITLILSLVN